MAALNDLPSPLEKRLAYGTAVLSSLLWVACVVPGAVLADPSLPDDLSTPMYRGALLLVPALLLLVACPVAAVLATHPLGVRALLAWGDAFVTLYTATALAAGHPSRVGVVAAIGLAVLGAVSVRDAIRIGRAAAKDPPEDVPPRANDARLALSLLALLTPASVLARGAGERASWLAPFAFVALGALGERFSHDLRGLRRTCAGCLVVLGAHLVISVRYALNEGRPPIVGWTWAGWAAFTLTFVVLACPVLWVLALAKPSRVAAEAATA